MLQDSDLDTLRGPCFLTDEVIAFFFTHYLSSTYKTDDILLVEPSTSLLLANCEDQDNDTTITDFAESCKLSTKKLVLFPVNDCYDFDGGDTGSHWSLLVYDRSVNMFLHFDSMLGVNTDPAQKLYEVVARHVGPPMSVDIVSKKNKKKTKKTKMAVEGVELPVLREWETMPQQTNGYDCGVYVLAIARVVCRWYVNEKSSSGYADLLSVVAGCVDESVEVNMRAEVLDIILHNMSNNED